VVVLFGGGPAYLWGDVVCLLLLMRVALLLDAAMLEMMSLAFLSQ